MAGIKKRLGSILGPEGRVPQITNTRTTQVSPGTPASAELIKTGDAQYRMDLEIPRGLDGDPTAVADFGKAMAAEINTVSSEGHTALKEQTAEAMWDVTPQAADLANASGSFTAAAAKAKAEGRNVLRVAPGTYTVPGLHPDDILDLYVIGDGVRLVGNPVPNLYPFTTEEWVQRGATQPQTGGRGVVAFEVDDGVALHWSHLFPVCKELGITMGSPWHTGNGQRWHKEAHRHGWEIISHLPANTAATSISLAELEAQAVESLDAIEAITGDRDSVGFVYPQHDRSLETDRVLSKYYTRGRGINDDVIYPRGDGHPWLTAAMNVDSAFTAVWLDNLKAILRDVATTDGQIVLYLHYNTTNWQAYDESLRELVPFIRALGMEIRNPGQVWGGTNIIQDSYDERGTWTFTGSVSRSTARAYKGDTSARLTSSGGSVIAGIAARLTPKPGQFGIYRASVRFDTGGFTTTSSSTGPIIQILEQMRNLDGSVSAGEYVNLGRVLPATGTTQGPLSWAASRRLVYLQPSTIRTTMRIGASGIATGEAYVDELKMDLVGYASSLQFEATLAGASNRVIATGIPSLSRCGVVMQAMAPVTGNVTFSLSGASIIFTSDSPLDTATVRFIVTPGPAYNSMALTSEGA